MNSETSNAVLAIATAFLAITSVIGIFFTGYQIRLAILQRSSAHEQRQYETEVALIMEFTELESSVYVTLRRLLNILLALTKERRKEAPSVEQMDTYRKYADTINLELGRHLNNLHTIGGKLRIFMPNTVVDAASTLYLDYVKCIQFLEGIEAHLDVDKTAERYELLAALLEKTQDSQKQYITVVREKLGVEVLHKRNLDKWTPSSMNPAVSAAQAVAISLVEITKG